MKRLGAALAVCRRAVIASRYLPAMARRGVSNQRLQASGVLLLVRAGAPWVRRARGSFWTPGAGNAGSDDAANDSLHGHQAVGKLQLLAVAAETPATDLP